MKILKIAIYLFALIGFLGSVYVGLIAYQFYSFSPEAYDAPDPDYDPDAIIDEYFSRYIYFDYAVSNLSQNMPAPSLGDAKLYGEITYNEAPVVGIKLDVILNSKFKVESLTTDAQGRFYLDVPAGKWIINAIVINAWKNKPKGEFIVLTGYEPLLGDSTYNRHSNRAGPQATVKDGEVSAVVKIAIAKPLEISEPSVDDELASPDDAAISWAKVSGAETYLIKILEVHRQENGSTFYEILEKRVQGTELAFSDIGITNASDEEAQIYRVEIMAFDENGKLISKSAELSRREFAVSNFRFISDQAKLGAARREVVFLVAGTKAGCRLPDSIARSLAATICEAPSLRKTLSP